MIKNEALYEAWIQELEAGVIKQGKNRLRNTDDEMCCLGVACEVASRMDPDAYGSWADAPLPEESYGIRYICDDENEASVLPEAIRDALNLRTAGADLILDDMPRELQEKYLTRRTAEGSEPTADPYISFAALNDHYDFSFNDIAWILRSRPRSLFMPEALR